MKVDLIQHTGKEMLPKILGVCRNKPCTDKTLQHCLTAKPVPHLSILEFMWFNFYIQGLSIKARIQLLRHRMFSTMERSTRSINLADYSSGNVVCALPFNEEKSDHMRPLVYKSTQAYKWLVEDNEPLEDAAYVLPLATATNFYLAGNGRVFFEYLQKRLCFKHTQSEHYHLASKILLSLNEAGYKDIFQHARPCLSCRQCEIG